MARLGSGELDPMASCTSASGRMNALFTTAVWGNAYLDRFLNYSLRTQLSDGNLGAFDKDSLFLLITDAADLDRVKAAPAFRALSRLVDTECVAREAIVDSSSANKYARLTACQNYALQRSEDFDAIFFGYGDAIWADGSYRTAMRRLAEGYDAVFCFGYPVVSAPFLSAIDDLKCSATADAIVVSPQNLARQTYDHLHSMARGNDWKNEYMGQCSSYVTWDVPGAGLLVRSFHLHPVAVRVRRDLPSFFKPFRSTLDEEFVSRLYRTYPRVYVCTSSDELGGSSLAEEAVANTARRNRRRSAGVLAEFAEAHAGMLHREFFSHSIRLVIGDASEEKWQAAESEAARLAADIERRLATPDSVLALEVPAAYDARWRRQTMLGHMSPEAPQLKRTMDGLDRLHAAVRRSERRIGFATINALHALYITRAARVVLLPMLSLRQRRWCYEFISGLGIDVPLINSPHQASSSFRISRLWRWLRSLIRAHA